MEEYRRQGGNSRLRRAHLLQKKSRKLLAETGRSGIFPGSLKRKSPDHAAISVAQVLELGDVPWLLNDYASIRVFLSVLELGDVPWLLNDYASIRVFLSVLELGDVLWLLNLPCFVTAAERAHSVCKVHPERQRAEGISPRPSFLLPKIPYLVAPQEEHRYPVVTVSSYAADTSTFSEYASLTTLYS